MNISMQIPEPGQDIDMFEIKFDFQNINTDAINPEIMTDKMLIEHIKTLDLFDIPGYGLIAELAKRYCLKKGIE